MEPPPESQPNPQKGERDGSLRSHSILGLVLVGLLVMLNPLVLLPSLARSLSDAPRINLAGRQRMYSQRLVKEALAVRWESSEAGRNRRRKNLEQALAAWSSAQTTLRVDGLQDDPNIVVAFHTIEPEFRRIRQAATRIVEGTTEYSQSIQVLLLAEPRFLENMERIVDLFEVQAQQRIGRAMALLWVLTGLIMLGLVAIAWLVLKPAAKRIERQFGELRDARDELEVRVQASAQDLERTHQELAREGEERSKAEARYRSLLEQFSHDSRSTTIGEMASGLAHELNQPLGATANYIEGCLAALERSPFVMDEVRAALHRALTTTLRAGAIVQRIHRFVTRQPATRELFWPHTLVRDVEDFFRSETERRGISFQVVAPEMPCCWGDPIQVQQVLVNLLRNALDAVSSSQTEPPEVVMAVRRLASGGTEFSILDNGEGIAVESLPRIFEAYFSTRAEGMGMGLAISRTIAEAHQGRLEVESRPGRGSRFRLILPESGVENEGADGLHRG